MNTYDQDGGRQMKFISVYLIRERREMAINVDDISYVASCDSGTRIGTKYGKEFVVGHCYDEIMGAVHEVDAECRVYGASRVYDESRYLGKEARHE